MALVRREVMGRAEEENSFSDQEKTCTSEPGGGIWRQAGHFRRFQQVVGIARSLPRVCEPRMSASKTTFITHTKGNVERTVTHGTMMALVFGKGAAAHSVAAFARQACNSRRSCTTAAGKQCEYVAQLYLCTHGCCCTTFPHALHIDILWL